MNSLDILVSGLFDYAGMYPPAELSLETSLQNSLSFQRTLHRPQMVAADLVLEWRHLKSFSENLSLSGSQRPFTVALLGSPCLGSDSLSRFSEELLRLSTESFPATVLSFEVRCGDYLNDLLRASFTVPNGIQLYLESNSLLKSSERNAVLSELSERGIGVKIRCSEAPPPSEIASLLKLLGRRGSPIPFKATAGLHHPLVETERYQNSLGFLGLVTSYLLGAHFPEISEEALTACLESSDPAQFSFTGGLRWREWFIPDTELAALKARYPLRIGSCSLAEPDDDLRRLFPAI